MKLKKFLALFTAAMMMTAISGCGSSSSADSSSSDSSADSTSTESKGTVTLLSWGGSIETAFLQDGMAEKFKEETGYDFELVQKSDSAAIISQALAQKDNPQVDVVLCDIASHLEGHNAGLWEPITEEKVPNIASCLEQAVYDDYLYCYFTVSGIIYDADDFEANGWDVPTSYEDLYKPEFAGKVAFDHFPSSYSDAPMMLWAEENGGSYENMDPAFEKLAALAPSVYEFIPSYGQLAQWFADDEISVATYVHNTTAKLQKEGVNAQFVIPEEGTYLMPTAVAVMKNAPNPEGAMALVNFIMGEEYQTYRYENHNDIPANTNVELDPESPITWDVLNAAKVFDYDKISEYRPGWVDRFNEEIVPIAKNF